MLELFQTEWCPASRRVRELLTELDVDYVSRQVPAEREERDVLRAVVGVDSIPVLRLGDGSVVVGEDAIVAYLHDHVSEPRSAEGQRLKAAKMLRRYLEEECDCR